ncbi:uncharacterized protein BX664DRAFT_339540 [Halteromyces radiatus]|uniref:uncharacterized protein n=1 Tax=Halteromyces radiatus TaxID=101107 RepID=UPI00221FD1BF|nr:uncharacterized protein BX664DRAFT_339540 [Halteromyces radiatus]KAI8082978.1 hypothetical protein BX664DRAFT_339540 [Halteromyces radiatus]
MYCSLDSSLFGYINKSCKTLEKLAILWELDNRAPPWETTTQGERCLEVDLPDIGLETCALKFETDTDLVVITQKKEEKWFCMSWNDKEDQRLISLRENQVLPRLPYYEDESQWPSLTATLRKDYYWKQMDPILDGTNRHVSNSMVRIRCRYLKDLCY